VQKTGYISYAIKSRRLAVLAAWLVLASSPASRVTGDEVRPAVSVERREQKALPKTFVALIMGDTEAGG
jgi:hypothetical protein